jgi:hypothetical protein
VNSIAAKPVPLERKRAMLMQRKGKTWSDPFGLMVSDTAMTLERSCG